MTAEPPIESDLNPRKALSVALDLVTGARYYANGETADHYEGDRRATAVTLRRDVGWAESIAVAACIARRGCQLACPDEDLGRILAECHRACVWGAGPGDSLDQDWANAAALILRIARRPDDSWDLATEWLRSRGLRAVPGAHDAGWASTDAAAGTSAHGAAMQALVCAAQLLWYFATLTDNPCGLLDRLTIEILERQLREDIDDGKELGA